MPEQGTRPVNKYLPPRPRKPLADSAVNAAACRKHRRRQGLLRLARRHAGSDLTDASSSFDHLLHHAVRPRLRAGGSARAWPARSGGTCHQHRLSPGAGADFRRAAVLDAASRQPAARLAGAVAMAVELAVARGRDGDPDLRAAGHLGMGRRCSTGALFADGRLVGTVLVHGHGLLHGDDLCLAEIRAGVAHEAHAALLPAFFHRWRLCRG